MIHATKVTAGSFSNWKLPSNIALATSVASARGGLKFSVILSTTRVTTAGFPAMLHLKTTVFWNRNTCEIHRATEGRISGLWVVLEYLDSTSTKRTCMFTDDVKAYRNNMLMPTLGYHICTHCQDWDHEKLNLFNGLQKPQSYPTYSMICIRKIEPTKERLMIQQCCMVVTI